MNVKKIGIVVLAGCLMVTAATLAAGCKKDEQPEQPTNPNELRLTFIDEEYVLSGMGEPFIEVTLEIEPESELTYATVFSALREPAEEGHVSMLLPEYKINHAQLPLGGSEITVDFSSDGLNGSSMQEYLLISQIVRSLCMTFENIQTVQFTVDGSMAETLMGHMGIMSPYMLQAYVDENGEIDYTVESVQNIGL